MNLSMYQASVPVCMRMFRNFVRILEKGGAYAAEREIDRRGIDAARDA